MKKEMLINTVEGQECRIAIMAENQLEELYVERASSASHVGNIYKGRITNVEPSIQAAFVDFGGVKNGFLHITDVHPHYFRKKSSETEAVGRKRPQRERPPIQDCLRRGQEVVVQMTKEGIGTKGPTLTTYLSIPGRLLVMMPGMSRLGVSRKVDDDEARAKARKILNDLDPPDDMGFIIRTAGVDRPKRDLQRDLRYLVRLWKNVNDQAKKVKAPAEIYRESDLVIRTIRDVYNTEVKRIICDSADVAQRVKEFLEMAVPRSKHKIEYYTGKEGLFHEFGLEEEIEKIYSRRVELKSGGSLVIDQTEALVAIDVNSGRFRDHSDAETTAFRLNQEAAREVLRQLRLRDLGGVVVIDFVDMRQDKNRRGVEKIVREGLKSDRAKTKVLRMSAFGLLELTRQRVRPSLKDSIYHRCSYCNGMGLIKSDESQSLMVMRILQRATSIDDVAHIEVEVTPAAAHHLGNYQRAAIARLERETGKRIVIRSNPELAGHEVNIECTNSRGSSVAWDTDGRGKGGKGQPRTIPIEQVDHRKIEADKALPDERRDAEAEDIAEATDEAKAEQADQEKEPQQGNDNDKPRKKRRRGRRGGRKHRKDKNKGDQQQDQSKDQQQDPDEQEKQKQREEQKKREQEKQKQREEQKKREQEKQEQYEEQKKREQEKQQHQKDQEAADRQHGEDGGESDQGDQDQPRKKRRRGKRGGRKHKKKDQQPQQEQASDRKDTGEQEGKDEQKGSEPQQKPEPAKEDQKPAQPEPQKKPEEPRAQDADEGKQPIKTRKKRARRKKTTKKATKVTEEADVPKGDEGGKPKDDKESDQDEKEDQKGAEAKPKAAKKKRASRKRKKKAVAKPAEESSEG
ncbi:MAG: Rne/Rng family ribonuclease [Phycisphaerae bacterium]